MGHQRGEGQLVVWLVSCLWLAAGEVWWASQDSVSSGGGGDRGARRRRDRGTGRPKGAPREFKIATAKKKNVVKQCSVGTESVPMR